MSTVILYKGTFGSANGQLNVNRHLGQAGVAVFVSERFSQPGLARSTPTAYLHAR